MSSSPSDQARGAAKGVAAEFPLRAFGPKMEEPALRYTFGRIKLSKGWPGSGRGMRRCFAGGSRRGSWLELRRRKVRSRTRAYHPKLIKRCTSLALLRWRMELETLAA